MSSAPRPTPRSAVSLAAMVDELDVIGECTTYVNRKTGKVVVVTEEDSYLLGDDVDEDALADWQVEILPKLREATTSDDYLVFSVRDELNEYDLMERFAHGIEDERVRARLQRALRGRGAYRNFKDAAREHGLLDAWYAHRQRALEDAVADWLEENGIPFTRP